MESGSDGNAAGGSGSFIRSTTSFSTTTGSGGSAGGWGRLYGKAKPRTPMSKQEDQTTRVNTGVVFEESAVASEKNGTAGARFEGAGAGAAGNSAVEKAAWEGALMAIAVDGIKTQSQ